MLTSQCHKAFSWFMVCCVVLGCTVCTKTEISSEELKNARGTPKVHVLIKSAREVKKCPSFLQREREKRQEILLNIFQERQKNEKRQSQGPTPLVLTGSFPTWIVRHVFEIRMRFRTQDKTWHGGQTKREQWIIIKGSLLGTAGGKERLGLNCLSSLTWLSKNPWAICIKYLGRRALIRIDLCQKIAAKFIRSHDLMSNPKSLSLFHDGWRINPRWKGTVCKSDIMFYKGQ